ncbi:hypothetical protein PTI98_004653 [Pleurotus ostreatus]|nr:hypothetical protein PTI98_004653 [Pleurotus ostreatus]
MRSRELLCDKLIGRHVKVHVDFVRPREGEHEEREYVTIQYDKHNAQLIEKGLAPAVRHRRDAEAGSPDLYKLLVAEQA